MPSAKIPGEFYWQRTMGSSHTLMVRATPSVSDPLGQRDIATQLRVACYPGEPWRVFYLRGAQVAEGVDDFEEAKRIAEATYVLSQDP